jgi:hypothetical protein
VLLTLRGSTISMIENITQCLSSRSCRRHSGCRQSVRMLGGEYGTERTFFKTPHPLYCCIMSMYLHDQQLMCWNQQWTRHAASTTRTRRAGTDLEAKKLSMSNVRQMAQVSQVKLGGLSLTSRLFQLLIHLLVHHAPLQFLPERQFQNCESR